MMTHLEKKLNFMGNELAIFREWDESRETDWEQFAPFINSSTAVMRELITN